MKHKIFGITGWKNNGKTTMVVAIVKELTKRGYQIATIKHAHHNFDIDHENTDSFRHRKAGASEVAIVSSKRFALIHETQDNQKETTLDEVLNHLSPCDLVIIEGYKSEPHAKLEVRRQEGKRADSSKITPENIVAIAADYPINKQTLPIFNIDDIDSITDFIENYMELKKGD